MKTGRKPSVERKCNDCEVMTKNHVMNIPLCDVHFQMPGTQEQIKYFMKKYGYNETEKSS